MPLDIMVVEVMKSWAVGTNIMLVDGKEVVYLEQMQTVNSVCVVA